MDAGPAGPGDRGPQARAQGIRTGRVSTPPFYTYVVLPDLCTGWVLNWRNSVSKETGTENY